MRGVVMAGGEGTRLRPLTTNVPKPLLPVVGEPMMGHLLRLLARHGVEQAVVTVQYLAASIRSYFGVGQEYGVRLSYATESVPLGTAGSVRNARAGLLEDEPFLVVSGDAVTDMDLTALFAHHQRTGAAVTVALARKPNVVEFGNVITGDGGRIERFIEKPSWGQVFSDTVNTGIYVVEPFVLDLIAADRVVDWSGDVFPALLAAGQPMQGYISEAYWEDVGTLDSYLAVQRDVLTGRVGARIGGFEVAPSVWLGEDVFVDPTASLIAPCFVGPHSHVGQDCTIGPGTVLGSNVVVRRGSRVAGSLLDTGVYVDTACEVQSALVGRASEIRARVHVDQGAVIGDQCVLQEEVHISPRVRIYPARTIEAGAVVTDNVVWEGQGHRSLFGPRGVSGTVNLDITPEMVVRLGSAYASLLPKGSIVTVGRDHSRAARAMNRALAGSLTASGLSVRDLRVMPLPIVRADTARAASAGVYLRTTLGQPDSLDIVILDATGSDLSVPDQQRLERTLVRGDYRRAFPDEIGDIHTPHRVVDEYVSLLHAGVNTEGVARSEAPLKVVIDTGLGAASLVMPRILSLLGVSVLTVNSRLDEDQPTSSRSSYHAAMARLGELVATSHSDLGVRFDPTGERLSLVDETGRPFEHGRALLVMLDLVAAERRSGAVGLPISTTRVARAVAEYHGVGVEWTAMSGSALSQLARRGGLIFAGDGRGGFVIPEVGPNVDGIAAFVRLVGLVARTRLTLSAIDRRIPQAQMLRTSVPTPWGRRGAVMRSLVEAAGSRAVDTTEGVRIEEADGAWVLAVPDQVDAVIRLWVEAPEHGRAETLMHQWVARVTEQAA
jgi:mannose-1-phosphate guanylyltransferase/phosphomannomutase